MRWERDDLPTAAFLPSRDASDRLRVVIAVLVMAGTVLILPWLHR